MNQARVRFYAELNDFLPPARRGVTFTHEFRGGPSVKDLVESLGVPHVEIDLILADGEPVDFSWIVRDGARVSVYPDFESIDITPLVRLRPGPLRQTRFVLDGHLGRLARHLRMLGFDTRWQGDRDDAELARISADEQRILLTRDRGLLMRRAVSRGHWMRETDPRRQLAEVVGRFDLARAVAPFGRCLRCNDLLEPRRKEEVLERLPPSVRRLHQEFRQCPACGRVYWKGSHHRRMEQVVAEVVGPARDR